MTGLAVYLILISIANAIRMEAAFESHYIDNIPQTSLHSKSAISCGSACLYENKTCKGFRYQDSGDYINCFLYQWLTLGGEETAAFIINKPAYVTQYMMLDTDVTVNMSSQHSVWTPGSEAIDGIYATNSTQSSLAHTSSEESPWLQVNLVMASLVRGVKIWNRCLDSQGNCDRLRNVLVSIALSSMDVGFGERFTLSACSYSPGTQPHVRLHLCYEAMLGEAVRITSLHANAPMNLYEVEIHV